MRIDMLSCIVKLGLIEVIFAALGELHSMTVTIQVVQCQMELMVEVLGTITPYSKKSFLPVISMPYLSAKYFGSIS